ncbi:MAG: flagellin [Burkholderiaceae bacterium]|jgi:flagellin|nr:flagellin FliC [Burkholderiaceae bacterium]
MAQIINTNLISLNTQRNLTTTQGALALAVQRLSSGLRVNSAKDDAAGLAIAERMNSQVRGMNVAIRNANDGISLAQTAEGALGKVGDMLQRMRELAVQAANATNGTADRANLDAEYQQLSSQITDTITKTKFNGTAILATGTAQVFQVGANVGDTISVAATDLSADATITAATGAGVTGADATNANAAMTAIDAALTTLNTQRANWGAVQNRFDAVIGSLQVATENQAAARSRIMDADFAAETAALTRAQVLQQAGTAMLSQANSLPNNVLALLR